MAQVYILGAGTPTPTAHRFGSSFVLQLDDQYLMFDCGPATTWKLVRSGLFPTQIGYLFFTHHHFDHDVDYPCLLLTRWDQSVGKEKEFEVFGPSPTEKLTYRLLDEKEGAFAQDWLSRVNDPTSQRLHVRRGGTLPRKPPSVLARDVGPGRICHGPDWEVTAAVGVHAEPWLDSLAYRVDSEAGSIVFMGDTVPCPAVLDLCKDADIVMACCWDHEERTRRYEAIYGSEGMPSTLDAGRFAQEAGAQKLVLVHVGHELARHGDMEKGIAEIAKVYDGEIVFSEEFMSFGMKRR
jgi:ribonuclease BN (tRNA processing enzyme)